MSTFWVDPTSGNDANNGTSKALAVATFAQAETLLSNGDTLKIADGTHDVSSQAGTVIFDQTNLTIVSENNNPTTCTLDYVDTNLSFTVYDNFTFSGVTITRPHVDGSPKGVFSFNDASTTMNITRSYFTEYNLSATYCGLFNLSNKASVTLNVSGCVFYAPKTSTPGYTQGVSCSGLLAGDACNINYTNCVFYAKAGQVPLNIIGARFPTNWTVLIKNCIAYAGTNVTYNATNSEADLTVNGNSASYSYCCNYDAVGTVNVQDFADGGGNITTDPLMVDPENLLFQLQPTSPCIDTGGV
jgi:hypothetical protein